jgi:polypyrimidine tract-binding protein 2
VPAPASRVIHVRNLPHDCLEAELTLLLAPFGLLHGVLLMQGKGQALVQFAAIESAMAALQYYEQVPALVRGREAYLQFSAHQQLTASSSAGGNASGGGGGGGASTSSIGAPNHVLLVTIDNTVYPINVDTLHAIFAKYGQIVKIVIFSKPGQSPLRLQVMTISLVIIY